ncbi:hypothetical protein SAMN05421686_10665 [Thalassolituus maritimus]|uniref:Ribosomal protein L7/L12 C-terminal domain-containing protein n=1 Tax=Thalassolituus maritimus TaxID=484498 RepID=A0A1N7MYP2_9GAMM|nr:hypothetical protein [Thalassolituus maritimus]SIS91192.1 hypothetical protein SAMN05421686_10665 [Thalassolituus maritimus]
MELNKLTLAVLAATSMTLVGCGGGSSSSSDDETGDDIVTPDPLAVYTDTAWSLGADELVGLTYPQNATNGDMVALKRSTGSDDSISHTLMVAPAATKEFVAVEGVALEKDYYRDVLALPVSGTVEGEEIDTVLIATCGYEEASMIEGGEIPMRGEVGPRAVAVEEETQTPASLEIYLAGTDISTSLDINDETEGNYFLVDCHSLGGLSASDLSSKGTDAYEVDFFITGKDSTGEVAVFEASLIYNYENNEVTESDFAVLESIEEILSAVAEDPEDDFLVAMTTERRTYLLSELKEAGIELNMESNPFTSEAEEGAIILDLVYSGENLLAVSDDAGLAGADFTGGEYVLLSGGDFTRCVDQLAVNGTTVWCHDSTDEGKLIEFTAPTVPQSDVVEEIPEESPAKAVSLAASSYKASKEEAEQIKAELEGAGAEVEVK